MSTEKAKRLIREFENTHNHSWYEEIWIRNRDALDDTALIYRANRISYRAMFRNMRVLASAMQLVGVRKGTEIPVCLSNSPELVYVMGAASMLGAVINVFSPSFPLDYIEEILSGCDSCVGFFEDNSFSIIRAAVEASGLEHRILCSLSDSLPSEAASGSVAGHGFRVFESSVRSLTAEDPRASWLYDFMATGSDCGPEFSEKVTLEDEFSVTYTSGSTNALRPKAIVQRVRSFTVIGRFHDPDVTYGLSMKRYRWMALIPPHSNTDLISCISDALMQGSALTMEPVYDEHFFLDSLLNNQPNVVIATRSFWMTAMKSLAIDPAHVNTKLPFLLMAFAAGEELSINEERFLNRILHKRDAGRDFHRLPISPICFCVGGGDCEHGSILHQLFRAVTNPIFGHSAERRYGMTPFDFVDIAVLDAEGNKCGPNQVGRLVANSPCTMKCYKNDPEATAAFFITDSDGELWGDMSVYGYVDKRGRVYMRNRILGAGQTIPPFMVADEILKDRAVLSCEVVDTAGKYVAHVEYVPGRESRGGSALQRAKRRCERKFGSAIRGKLLFRVHAGTSSFPLTHSGKRDVKALIAEGVTRAIEP